MPDRKHAEAQAVSGGKGALWREIRVSFYRLLAGANRDLSGLVGLRGAPPRGRQLIHRNVAVHPSFA